MQKMLLTYLAQRADAAMFLLPAEIGRTIEDLFPRGLLPEPFKIFLADESLQPILGLPLLDTPVLKELESKLDRWLTEEIPFQIHRQPAAKEKAQIAFGLYISQLMKVAENALISNLLNDYHAVFWLAHSFDLAKHFTSIPRRVGLVDSQAGKTQGDTLKYRIFSKWVGETREQMTQLATRAASILDGDEQRGLQFLRLLQDDVLILTEEFIGPDLRELRSFLNGYLRRDFHAFRDAFERYRTVAQELLHNDKTFRTLMPILGAMPEGGISLALLLDSRAQSFFFEHPSVQNVLTREDRDQLQLITRRLREFAVLNHLRRSIVFVTQTPEGDIVPADRRSGVVYSRSTRAMDFSRPGVVDPVVHRFGLIYDLANFTETLGNIRRGGGKEELKSYRQMLLFLRKLEAIAQRHRLQFEKFLGDGAFYTTRRALRLLRAAVEIQRYYSELKRKGFAFNKGLRIALNYGYYRLLPMRTSFDSDDMITEFYGPGIVELSRLTTGKANKEIDEFASFLMAQGYDQARVQAFFAPLASGVDMVDHAQHAREFYAYVNANGHLINEGIVASIGLLQELSHELTAEGQQLYRLKTGWASYIGFAPAVPGLEFVGLRMLGMVSLKGLDKIDVAEIVPFAAGEAEATPLDTTDPLLILVRQDFHQQGSATPAVNVSEGVRRTVTAQRDIETELVICFPPSNEATDQVLIGEWDPRSDDVRRPVVLPRGDFQRLFSMKGRVTAEALMANRKSLRDLYQRLSDRSSSPAVALASYRVSHDYDAFIVGDVVEKL